MRKIKSMSIRQFLHGEVDASFTQKAKKYITNNKSFYVTIAGATIFFLFTGMDGVEAASEIDTKARSIYDKLIGIGKWVIVFKGALEMIQNLTSGNFQEAKAKFLQYLLIFIMLLGLPWAMDEVESLFKGS